MIIAIGVSVALTTIFVSAHLGRKLGERIVVHLAGVDRPVYALDLVSCGIGRRGTIYVTLASLESDGLLRSWNEPNPPASRRGYPRRMFEITDRGRRVARVIAVRGLS